jgi:hypothetical protein
MEMNLFACQLPQGEIMFVFLSFPFSSFPFHKNNSPRSTKAKKRQIQKRTSFVVRPIPPPIWQGKNTLADRD